MRICLYIVQVFLQYSEPISFEHVLNPICSDVIVDKHAHQLLKIDDSFPVIATDEGSIFQKYWAGLIHILFLICWNIRFIILFLISGIDHCIILCSKIEDSDLNKLALIFKFKKENGESLVQFEMYYMKRLLY